MTARTAGTYITTCPCKSRTAAYAARDGNKVQARNVGESWSQRRCLKWKR